MSIHTFEVNHRIGQQDLVLHPTLLSLNGRHYLVDAGYEETFPAFVEVLRRQGLSVRDLHAILVSHDDIDHIGGLCRFKEANPDLLVYCSHTEEPSVSGKVKSERLLQAERMLDGMPEEHKPWALQFIESLKGICRLPVDHTFQHNDLIEDECVVMATPGHTRGHVSFFLPRESILIANDALVIEDGQFNIANPQFTLDLPRALQSVASIRSLAPATVICYHGGVATERIAEKLDALLDRHAYHG